MRRCEFLLLSLSLAWLLVGLPAVRAEEPVAAVDLTGRWCGTWASCRTGHHGPLNATFCKLNDTCYQVRFTGRFLAVLPFRFTVPLQVVGQEPDKVFLAGAPRLPLFGTFHFAAVATEREFDATYSARNDQGRFTLRR